MYVVNVAPAASGKDHPQVCVPRLLKAAGAGVHVKVRDITAQTAFNKIATQLPLGVVVIDEVADFLGRIARSKNAWERGLVAALRTQRGRSFQVFGTTTSAERDGEDIECPAISLFGAATREQFWEILQGAEVRNGLSHGSSYLPPIFAQKIDEDARKQEYFGRLAETTIRLATIRAAGRAGPGAKVGADDMTWGADLARAVTVGMMERSEECLPQTVRGDTGLVTLVRDDKKPDLNDPECFPWRGRLAASRHEIVVLKG